MPFGSRVKSVLIIPNQSQDGNRKLCFWTMLTQGGRLPLTPDSGSHRPRNGRLESHFWVCWDVVEATADYNSCCLCSPRVELRTEKCLPSIGTDDFFLSWLDCYFLFNLPSRKLTKKYMACPQQLHNHTTHKLAFSFSAWSWHSIYPDCSFAFFLMW